MNSLRQLANRPTYQLKQFERLSLSGISPARKLLICVEELKKDPAKCIKILEELPKKFASQELPSETGIPTTGTAIAQPGTLESVKSSTVAFTHQQTGEVIALLQNPNFQGLVKHPKFKSRCDSIAGQLKQIVEGRNTLSTSDSGPEQSASMAADCSSSNTGVRNHGSRTVDSPAPDGSTLMSHKSDADTLNREEWIRLIQAAAQDGAFVLFFFRERLTEDPEVVLADHITSAAPEVIQNRIIPAIRDVVENSHPDNCPALTTALYLVSCVDGALTREDLLRIAFGDFPTLNRRQAVALLPLNDNEWNKSVLEQLREKNNRQIAEVFWRSWSRTSTELANCVDRFFEFSTAAPVPPVDPSETSRS
jgi:hypothetical protein